MSPFTHQALLLVANSVDSNADCTRLVVDGWLELELREAEGALKVLSTALSLRTEWERLLLAQLGQSTIGGPAVQGVSRKTMEKLSDGLVRFLLYTEVLLHCWPGAHTHTVEYLMLVFVVVLVSHSSYYNVIIHFLFLLIFPLRSATACGDSQLSRPRTCTLALSLSLSCLTAKLQIWTHCSQEPRPSHTPLKEACVSPAPSRTTV